MTGNCAEELLKDVFQLGNVLMSADFISTLQSIVASKQASKHLLFIINACLIPEKIFPVLFFFPQKTDDFNQPGPVTVYRDGILLF